VVELDHNTIERLVLWTRYLYSAEIFFDHFRCYHVYKKGLAS